MKLTLCTLCRKIITVPLNIMSSALCSRRLCWCWAHGMFSVFGCALSVYHLRSYWIRVCLLWVYVFIEHMVNLNGFKSAHREHKISWTHAGTNLLGTNVFSCKKVILKTTSGHFCQGIGVTIRGFQRKKNSNPPWSMTVSSTHAEIPPESCVTESSERCIHIWGLWRQKQVSQAWISNCIPQNTVGCNYLSIPDILASGAKALILRVHLWDVFPIMMTAMMILM